MYVDTQFKWVDKSAIPTYDTTVVDNAPLFAATFSSDMGPEDIMVYDQDNFFDLCGSNISFAKHGQALLQVARIISNGGKVMGKRVVAPDATLANVILVAEVSEGSRQKTDPVTGAGLYLQENGEEGTEVTETPIMEAFVNITWKASSVENATTKLEIENQLEDPALYNTEGVEKNGVKVYSYPLFVFMDNGRGVSTKKVRFYSDYETSRSLSFMMNYVYVMNGTEDLEGCRFAPKPDTIYAGDNFCLDNQAKGMKQMKVTASETIMQEFINKIAELSGQDVTAVAAEDFMFGKTRKGKALSYITVDTDNGLDLTSEYGIALLNGTNGSFGDFPIATEDYVKESVKFWDGTFSDAVWDRTTYLVAAVCDANYDVRIKKAIEEWVDWREDCMFLRDLGTGVTSYETIQIAMEDVKRSKFVTAYCTTYDVKDPYTKRQINVTCTYDLATLLVDHIASGNVFRALAGISNGFVATSAIEGTVNFTPKITPSVNQKQLLEELGVNYATYLEGQLVFETLYTTQEEFTQLSYSNNVLAVQEVARAVRRAMPRLRYFTMDAKGLEGMSANINNLLIDYRNYFETLNFVYVEDRVAINNKIYEAGIEFLFKNFAQSEIFTLTALPVE